ncbi:DUF7260 family protein [Halorubrum tebenquichense]
MYQVLRRERNRTETECEAFEAFANRIAELQPSNAPSTANPVSDGFNAVGGARALESRPLSTPSTTDYLATIRDAYEETVMSVPFYETEYDDTYEKSVYEEFGQEVAIVLTQGSQFNRTVKQILLEKVEKAQAEREALIDTCDHEHESVTQAASVLEPIYNELRSYDSIPLDKQEFGALDAYRTRLQTMKDKCEQAAAARQATINHHRTEYNLSVEIPDICTYLYKTFETDYPVLFLCSELTRKIKNYRHQVEHAMSTCP